ncbi:Hint domain-containing protein [Acetobacter sp. AC2005]|uniref:Hint domain-containing protein n=1 Tax=Acetobacter sp. AC2005 TaxID=3134142 RepID=UPI0030D1CBA0
MATDTWTGAAGDNNWNTASNWSGGVPTSDSDVVINTNTTQNQTINIPSAIEISSLTITGDTNVALNNYTGDSSQRVGFTVDNDISMDNYSGTLQVNSLYLMAYGNMTGGTVAIDNSTVQPSGTFTSVASFWPTANSDNPNYLNLTGSQKSVPSVINFSSYDAITFNTRQSDDGSTAIKIKWVSLGGNTYKVVNAANPDDVLVESLTFVQNESPEKIGYDGDTATINCFLAGSLIETPEGLRKIEDMQVGDAVCIYADGKKKVSHVTWAGHAPVQVNTALKQDEAGYPIRIIANALADNVPSTDLLITPEHCLFFDGKFVPARMLVNGGSIFYDTSITSYEYYHIETAQHSIIKANGVLTESYLDTGNRAAFQQSGTVVTIGRSAPAKSWEHDAAAPLCVDRAFVEPLFHVLNYRKNSVAGCHATPAAVETTTNPDLHLVTQSGAIVHPMRCTTHHYSFMLPPNTQSVRIVSRASRPADVIGPFVDDRRYMGVAIADIQLLSADDKHAITVHLQAEKPAGWYATEPAGCVWTNGDALLPLDGYLTHGNMGMLSMTVQAGGPYIVENHKEAETQAHSA